MPIKSDAERKQYMRNYYKRHRKALLRKRKKRRDEDREFRRIMTDPHITIGKRRRVGSPGATPAARAWGTDRQTEAEAEDCESLIAAGQTVKPKPRRKPVKPRRKPATRKPSKGGKRDLRPRKERRRETGEDFTPIPLVNEMLDCLPPEAWEDADQIFLDPSCGNGNFLVEVKKRLLAAGHSEENALSRIFGIDLMHDNVVETCERLGVEYNPEASFAVSRTIVCANTLEHEGKLQELFAMAEEEFKKATEMAS